MTLAFSSKCPFPVGGQHHRSVERSETPRQSRFFFFCTRHRLRAMKDIEATSEVFSHALMLLENVHLLKDIICDLKNPKTQAFSCVDAFFFPYLYQQLFFSPRTNTLWPCVGLSLFISAYFYSILRFTLQEGRCANVRIFLFSFENRVVLVNVNCVRVWCKEISGDLGIFLLFKMPIYSTTRYSVLIGKR